jgi:NitT/TauT family transport system permease protein
VNLHVRNRLAFPIVAIVTIVVIWYALSGLLHVTNDPGANKLPYLHEVILEYFKNPGTYIEAAWSTASRAVVGMIAGLLVGMLLAVVMIQSKWIESAIVPYILASQMIPLVALVPIVRAVVRDPDVVRLYITAYVSFFVVTVALLRGLKNVSPSSLELMESLNASRWTTMRFVRFRGALPYLFSGLRIAAPLSLIGAILVDFLGARNGLGYLLVASMTIGSSQTTVLWGALLLALVIGLIFTQVVIIIERRLCFWEPSYRTAAR